MAKKKTNNKKKMYKAEITTNTSFKESISKIIKILVIVLIIFGIFYLLTVYLTNRKESSSKRIVSEAIIQYEEILAGSSFNMKSDEYIVIYYDKSNDDLKSNITNYITNYQDKENHLSLYTVDMSSAFNNKFNSSESNDHPSIVNDLKINGPTLIKFINHDAADYIEGVSEIENYLKQYSL